jgi:ribosomal protein L2
MLHASTCFVPRTRHAVAMRLGRHSHDGHSNNERESATRHFGSWRHPSGADGYATVRLPSGEQRKVLERCRATVGALSNPQHKNRKLGKAGASRWMGRRPTVRTLTASPKPVYAC